MQVGLFVLRGGFLEHVQRLGLIGNLEHAGRSAAGGAARHVSVVDVDVFLAELRRDVGERAGAIGEIDAEDFGFGQRQVEFLEHRSRFVGLFRDHAEHAVLLRIDKRHRDEVHFRIRERGCHLRENARFVHEEDRRKLVLDFEKVQYLSSQAIGIILTLNKKLAALKYSKLVLCGVGPKLMELLKITRLDRILTVKPTQAEAVKVFELV